MVVLAHPDGLQFGGALVTQRRCHETGKLSVPSGGDAGAVSVLGLQEVTEFTSRNRFVSPCRRECVWFTPSGSQRPDASSYVDKIAERPEDYRVLERLRLHAQITAAIHWGHLVWVRFK